MALEGSIRDFGLADILQLVHFHKKNGILTLTRQDEKVRLIFHEGNVIATESRNRAEEQRIGRIMLKEGLIKEDDLRLALEEQKKTGAKITHIFLKKGIAGKEDIKKTVTLQITDTVTKLFTWGDGAYEFEPGAVSLDKEASVSLDTQHLLMEGLRVVDEWSLVEGKITLDTVFKMTEGIDHALTPEEQDLLRFVDGENDVSIIIELSGGDDFEILKILVLLMDRGVIEKVEISPVITRAIAPPAAARPASFARSLSVIALILAFVLSVGSEMFHKKSQMSLAVFWDAELCHRLKTTKEIDKLRFMADVYKYKNGFYPKSLDQIGKAKDLWGRPYIYKFDNDSLAILSAGPDDKVGTEDDIY